MLELLTNHKYSEVFSELVSISKRAKEVFKYYSPEKYEMYGGNCCRQMSFICHQYLSDNIKDFKWNVFESVFILNATGQKFEHAWVYGRPIGKGRGIFVDLAFTNNLMENYLFEGENNFPGNIITENRDERSICNIERFKNQIEYYTSEKGKNMYEIVINFNTPLDLKQIDFNLVHRRSSYGGIL